MAAQQTPTEGGAVAYKPRYADIGINLADPIFRGRYHGTQRHPDDLEAVMSRAREVGCTKLMVTGSDFKSARDALELAEAYPETVFATAGIHPCSSAIFSAKGSSSPSSERGSPCDPDPSAPMSEDVAADPSRSADIIAELTQLLGEARSSGKPHLVAMGEFGLDYDRLHYCSKALQLHSFSAQLDVAASLDPQLPLFLHSRAAHADFVALLKAAFGEGLEKLEKGGVVHSFTGTVEEMRELVALGLHIGINGCSLKTVENCDVVKEIPLDKLMLETDGPWCEVRPSHEGYKYLLSAAQKNGGAATEPSSTGASTPTSIDSRATPKQQQQKQKKSRQSEPAVPSRWKVVKKEKWEEGAMVKGRNEPCCIERVATIVAGIKGVAVEEVCEAAWMNTIQVFRLGEIS